MTVRRINPGELSLVKNLEKRCFASNYFNDKEIDEMYESERYSFWGVWEKGIIAGYLILLDSIDIYEIIKVGVDDEYRGKGLGESLIGKAFDAIDVDLMLEVRESNKSARRLYEKLGFRKIGVRKGYYQDTKEDALIMVLGR